MGDAPLWLPCLFGAHEWAPAVLLRDGRWSAPCLHCPKWREAPEPLSEFDALLQGPPKPGPMRHARKGRR